MAASEALHLLYSDLVRVLQQPELLAYDLYAERILPEKALEAINVWCGSTPMSLNGR